MELLDIHDKYYDRVKSFIMKLVKDEWIADDLTQETFIKVQRNIGSVKDPSKLSSWVFKVAYNQCRDYFKSRKRNHHGMDLSRSVPGILCEMPVQKELEQFQMSACVQEQIDLLADNQRIILFLYDLFGFKHDQIAEILNISKENSKVRLHRARKTLKSILEKKCTFEIDERNVLVCEPVDNK